MKSWQTPDHRTLRGQASAAKPRRRMPASLWLTAALVLVLAATALSAGARVLADAAGLSIGGWAERAAGRPTPGPAGVVQPSPQPTAALAAPRGGCPPQSASAPADWPLATCDTFDDNASGWGTGEMQRRGGISRENIANGVYSFEADATDKFLDLNYAKIGPFSDFYMAVDVRVVEDTTSRGSEYGLVFRSNRDDQVYIFYVSDSIGFLLFRQVAGEATVPIAWLPTAAIRPKDWNRVAVKAAGKQLNFYINNEQVAEFSDEAALSGELGFMVFVGGAGHIVVHFDNFEVRSPEAPATPTSVSTQPPPTVACPTTTAIDPARWPLVVCDSFNDNASGWKTGRVDDERQATMRTVTDGKYVWEVRAFEALMSVALARFDAAADFYAAVNVRRAKGQVSPLRYGLQFRYSDKGTAYMVLASDDGRVQAYRTGEGGWETLTPMVETNVVKPGDWNRIAVKAVGTSFVVYINDQTVAAFNDEKFREGRFRLAVEVAQEDDYIVEFDNFEVRTAPPDAALTPMPTPVPTPTDTPTTGPTPSPSPSPRLLPTPPAEVSVASCPLGSPGAPANWPLLLCDSFDDNANNWEIGPFRDDRFDVTINADIANGVYTWDLDLSREWAVIKPCSIGVLADFYAAVDVFISEEAGTRVNYGLHFRSSDQGGYYALMVVNNTHVIVFRSLGDESASLLAQEMPDGVFQPGAWNRLAVMATGPAIAVFVNGQEIGRFSDPFIPSGGLALFSSNMVAGHFVLHFDNLEVRVAPPSAQLPSPTRPAVTWCPDSPAVAPADWPIFACDTFDDNSYGWRVGPDPLADIGESFLSIKGNYTWTYKTRESMRTGQEPLLEPVSDFFASVRGQRISLMEKTSYGLIFRMKDYSNFFAFTVNDSQQYGVQIWVNGFRRQLVEPTYSPAVRPNEANTLAVRGEGRRFTFYINDQQVDELYDIHFKEGKVGLIAFLERADEGRIEFDNFEVRTPPGKVK